MSRFVNRVWNGIDAIASVRLFAVFLALFLVFSYVFFPMHKAKYSADAKTLDSRFLGFAPQTAEDALSRFTTSDLVRYVEQELTIDLVFPIIYLLMTALALVLLGRVTRVPRPLVLIPFAAAIGDYTENFSIALMAARKLGGEAVGVFALVGSAGSRCKHVMLYSITVLVVWFALAAVWRRLRSGARASAA
jgi:hypothetical protein